MAKLNHAKIIKGFEAYAKRRMEKTSSLAS